MNTDSPNPYQPPNVQNPSDSKPSLSLGDVSTWFLSPILAVGCTLIIWLSIATLMQSQAAKSSNETLMILWATSLFFSITISVSIVAWFWPRRVSPISVGIGFAVFGIAFGMLEGDTSNGVDIFQISVLYATLISQPFYAYVLTRYVTFRRFRKVSIGIQ